MDRVEFLLSLYLEDIKQHIRRACSRVVGLVRPWVHRPEDGRGCREVYLDGEMAHPAIMADTRNGVVRCYYVPYRVNHRRNMVRTYKRRGHVEVRYMGENS